MIREFTICLALCYGAFSLCAQSLTLDQNFGTGGTIYQSEPAWAISGGPVELITLTNGKLLSLLQAGPSELVVDRFLPNGEMDNSFAQDGVFTSQISEDNTTPVALMVRPNGKIVVVAQASTQAGASEVVLIQLLENGTLDQSFGNSGMIRHGLTGFIWLNDAKLQQDGRLVVVGGSVTAMMALRFLVNGQVDTGFATNGIGLYSDGTDSRSKTLDIASDGSIILGGQYMIAYNAIAWTIVKLEPNGLIDQSFAQNGFWVMDMIPDTNFFTYHMEMMSDIYIETDGSVVVAGSIALVPNKEQFAVRKISSDGENIEDFGDNGLLLIGTPEQRSVAKRLVFDPTGQYLLIGYDAQNISARNLLVLRFDGNGNVIQPNANNSAFSHQMSVNPSAYCVGTIDHEGRFVIATGYYSKPQGKSSLSAFHMNGSTLGINDRVLDTASLSIWPNPTSGPISIAYTIDTPSKVNIDILDQTGRIVQHVPSASRLTAGEQRVQFDLGSNLSDGRYLMRMVQDGNVITRPLVLLR